MQKESDLSSLTVARHICKLDLWSFVQLVHNSRINDFEHYELCCFLQKFVEGNKRIGLVLASRDTLKTTICSCIFPLWLLVRDCNYRVLLDARVIEQSRMRVDNIRDMIQQNHWVNLLFPGMYNRDYKWSQDAMMIGTRNDFSAKEPSVRASGIDVETTGGHYHLTIADDVVTELNCEAEQTKTVIDHFRSLFPLLSAVKGKTKGKLLVVNTPYSEVDGIAWLKKTLAKGEIEHDLYIRRAYDPEGMDIFSIKNEKEFVKEGGVLHYPISLPFKKLREDRAMMGDRMFHSQYQLTVLPGKDSLFNMSLIRFFYRANLPLGLRLYIIVDPAGDPSDSKKPTKRDTDRTCILVVGVGAGEFGGAVYLIDGVADRMEETKAIEYIITYQHLYKPMLIAIEKAGLGNMAQHLTMEMRNKGIFAMIENLIPKGKSKFSRIADLVPLVDMGRLRVCEDAPVGNRLLYEMQRIRRDGSLPEHDDCVDALAWVMTLIQEYGLPLLNATENLAMRENLFRDPRSTEYWAGVAEHFRNGGKPEQKPDGVGLIGGIHR